jgi:hypothetical protein
MAARKRIVKKLPEFRLAKEQKELEEGDLKKVKAQTLKDLERNEKEWFDNELDKNLKSNK